ncbi:MAG: hypothetical protein ACI4XN_13785 [Candidatus Kurthia intestinigallinarum]
MTTEKILNEIELFCDKHNEYGCSKCPLYWCCRSCSGEFENDKSATEAAYYVIQMYKSHFAFQSDILTGAKYVN